jgi:putative Holliday junction resolvase
MSAAGRIVAVDFGTARIGLAISDSTQVHSLPLATVARRPVAEEADYFRRLALEERVSRFVVGLPIHADGRESAKSREARAFGEWLRNTTGLPVDYFDERYTSVEADALLLAADFSRRKRKARRDRVAAQILLSSYIESIRGRESPSEPLDD